MCYALVPHALEPHTYSGLLARSGRSVEEHVCDVLRSTQVLQSLGQVLVVVQPLQQLWPALIDPQHRGKYKIERCLGGALLESPEKKKNNNKLKFNAETQKQKKAEKKQIK